MKKILFSLFITIGISINVSYAQEATSNNDLRGNQELFTIKDLSSKKTKIYKLEESSVGQYYVSIQFPVQSELDKGNIKIDPQDANKLDVQFANHFITFQYAMAPRKKVKCQNVFLLNLRGEVQVVCKDEKEKIKQINKFIKSLRV